MSAPGRTKRECLILSALGGPSANVAMRSASVEVRIMSAPGRAKRECLTLSALGGPSANIAMYRANVYNSFEPLFLPG